MGNIWGWVALGFGLALGVGAVRLAGRGRMGYRATAVLAVSSVAVLLVLVATDWPSESLNEFWAEHSVVTTVITTLLLVGAGYLAFDSQSERRQAEIDDSVTAAGLGGLVETLADIDFALSALLTSAEVGVRLTRGPGESSKPLRWVRGWRDAIEQGSVDPRQAPVVPPSVRVLDPAWGALAEEVVTQCLRRLSGGLRDWSPLLTQSRDGRELLVCVARLREPLMALEELDAHGPIDRTSPPLRGEPLDAVWDGVRARSRALAWAFEIASGATRPRQILVTDDSGLADPGARALLHRMMADVPDRGTTADDRDRARAACLSASHS